jgi:hypothetical protein
MGPALGAFLLGLFLLARFGDMFRMPFLNDDYVFLDHVAGRSFGSLWGFHDLAFHWWRPWSREFHYWWLQGAFGPVEWPFHLASLLLSCGVLAAFWSLGRRLVGAPGRGDRGRWCRDAVGLGTDAAVACGRGRTCG